jgi:hypothetical protein
LCVRFSPAEGKTRFRIRSILDEHQHEGELVFEVLPDGTEKATIGYCDTHRDHRTFFSSLLRLEHIHRVEDA